MDYDIAYKHLVSFHFASLHQQCPKSEKALYRNSQDNTLVYPTT